MFGPELLAVDRVVQDAEVPGVSLILPYVTRDSFSAGPKTALEFALSLAGEMDRPLRVMSLDRWGWRRGSQAALRERSGIADLEVVALGGGAPVHVHADEVWIGTYGLSALALDAACRFGGWDRQRIVYLVQDYEPCFSGWSSEFALIQNTYHAGFHMVVNSQPLADYLGDVEGVDVPIDRVLSPAVDVAQIGAARARRHPRGPVQVFFYARPSRPRNLFELGYAALRQAASQLQDVDWELVVAGEGAGEMKLDVPGVPIRSVGNMTYDAYMNLLAETDVALSLMMSPHPSHPPLEVALAGGVTVTNRFGKYRDGLHPRLWTAPASVPDLAELFERAVRACRDPTVNADVDELAAEQALMRRLGGRSIPDVAADTAAALRRG